MPSPKKRVHSFISESTHQQQQPPPIATLPSFDPRHRHSPVTNYHPYTNPVMPYQLYQPHAHPYSHTAMSLPSTKTGISSAPHHSSQSIIPASATAASTSSGTATLPRYERILPKRLSDTSSTTSPSPSFGLHPFSYPYTTTGSHLSTTPARNLYALTPSASPPQPPALSTVDQRERARKVSHSAIERRRRERINGKIMQLKHIIPTCANQDNLHKLSILQSAIDYIHYLKTLIDEQQQQPPPPSPPSPFSQPEKEITQTTIESGQTPSDDSPLPSSFSMDPLVPVDIIEHPHPHHHFSHSPSTDPPTSSFHSLSLGKNNHMKVDNLLS